MRATWTIEGEVAQKFWNCRGTAFALPLVARTAGSYVRLSPWIQMTSEPPSCRASTRAITNSRSDRRLR